MPWAAISSIKAYACCSGPCQTPPGSDWGVFNFAATTPTRLAENAARVPNGTKCSGTNHAGQSLADDAVGFQHDAVNQFLDARDVMD